MYVCSFVTCTCVHSRGETLLLDPLKPASAAVSLWAKLDAQPPTAAVVLKPDHVRDVDYFVRRYGIPAYGPSLFFPDDVPETKMEPIEPGSKLPGDLLALYDGRGKAETPLWLPEQQILVFADALTSQGGVLRIWSTPWHAERVVPALTKLLDLPFSQVIVSHGDPVQTRAAYEKALTLPPWTD
jgi:glyoxylase-like metal-dependent hydrolase (beta-lactamase superfamily II)